VLAGLIDCHRCFCRAGSVYSYDLLAIDANAGSDKKRDSKAFDCLFLSLESLEKVGIKQAARSLPAALSLPSQWGAATDVESRNCCCGF
jgi:hypothetical protein